MARHRWWKMPVSKILCGLMVTLNCWCTLTSRPTSISRFSTTAGHWRWLTGVLPGRWLLRHRCNLSYPTSDIKKPASGGFLFSAGTGNGMQLECFGIRLHTFTGVQCCDCRQLFLLQYKTKHLKVFANTFWRDGLRDHNQAAVQMPADHHLRRALAIFFGQFFDQWLIKDPLDRKS